MRFLAVLELYKQGVVDLSQFTNFGELLVRRLQARRVALDAASLDDWDDDARCRRARRRRPTRERRRDRRPSSERARGRARPSDARPRLDARAIEAVVLAATEPVEARLLAQLVELPVARSRSCATSSRASTRSRGRGFVLARVAGGYRFQTHPDLAPTSSGSCSTASTPACRRRRSRRSRSSPTSSRSRAGRSRRSAASTSRPRSPRCCSAATCRRSGRDPGPGNAVLYGTTTRVPRTARARLARRPAAARRLRPRRLGRRGARARPPPAATTRGSTNPRVDAATPE